MMTRFLLLWVFLISSAVLISSATLPQASEQGPAPAPYPGNIGSGAPATISSVPSPSYAPSAHAPALTSTLEDSLIISPSPSTSSSLASEFFSAPEPSPEEVFPTTEIPEESGSKNVKWCAVGDEFVNCQYYTSLLTPVDDYTWNCVSRKTTFECLEAINNKEADLISLDSGLGYIAFMNYSMKAIMAEEYCYQDTSYDAVAIVEKKMCNRKGDLSLKDFKGKKSCHGNYLTAAGWNYPVNYILSSILQNPSENIFSTRTDEDLMSSFFSASCAPSELEGRGLCSACGNKSTCSVDKTYSGHSGAFRCLVEEIGDIAFLKADTALLYSSEGKNNQSWSTKSVTDFMYLCPHGGCRAINGFPGDCKFGSVPANTIMTRNSLPHSKKLAIVHTLLNASWTDVLYSGKNWADHLLSSSTQGLREVKELTRSYLGVSAHVSQTIENLNDNNVEKINDTNTPLQDSSAAFATCHHLWILAALISIYIAF
ncbi:uncharacterized protein LOC131070832 isoform X1 [Cryptomeria japonica]|uniref:uncharacterized protein LOC131070832 isoform X1 n=1 Tax=Cryptomeria japonica TaxID=3369 RepID=UPI0027DA0291|nr:uncharacterized protein LOC131070832 isoform X1 [Cryptomeria japonica]